MSEDERATLLRRHLSDEAQRIAIDAEYTGRQHLMAGQQWRRWAARIGLPAAILAASVGSGAAGLTALFGADARITAVIGFAGAIIGAVRLFVKADDQAAAHSTKGAQYLAIRGDARRFRKIDLNGDADLTVLTKQLHDLATRLDALREVEPRELPPGLYAKVQEQIKKGDYAYENDPLWERSQEGQSHADDGSQRV
jgi:hypothetical protein